MISVNHKKMMILSMHITYKHMDVERNHKDMKEYSNIIEIYKWIDVAINQKWKIRG